MDLLNGVLLVSVYLLTFIYELNLVIIYVTTFLLTVFTTFFGVGLESAKPNLVSEKMLMNINSISKIIDSVSLILGPMLGGIVYAVFDIRTFILLNGISFFVSGLSILFIDFKLHQNKISSDQKSTNINFISDIKEGFSYILGKKSIMSLFMILISINFFLGFAVTVPLPYIINNVLDLGSKEFGIIQAAFPAGMIAGALFVNRVMKQISYSALLKILGFSLSLLMVISGIPVLLDWAVLSYVIYYSGVMFFFGIIIALIDIPIAYIMQIAVPDEYRGRVLSIGISIGKTMLPLAMLASGALLSIIPAYFLPIAGGIIYLIFNIATWSRLNFDLAADQMG
jgi:hypothetical protein